MTQLSGRGAHFIGRFEGWRDKPYNDATNNATIGFGHLIHRGPVTPHDVSEWGTLTVDQGIQLLQRDAAIAQHAIEQQIERELNQCEWDALTSFTYNLGGGALQGSVGRAVNAGQDPSSAIEQYVHSGQVVLEGLVKRRQAEARLFTAGDYGDGQPPAAGDGAERNLSAHTGGGNAAAQVPNPVPDWAWKWVEWTLGRAEFKGHAGDPALRSKTGAPDKIPAWGWTFLKRFQ